MKNLERFNENNSSPNLEKIWRTHLLKDDLKTVKTNLFEIASEFLRNSSDFFRNWSDELAKLNSEGNKLKHESLILAQDERWRRA